MATHDHIRTAVAQLEEAAVIFRAWANVLRKDNADGRRSEDIDWLNMKADACAGAGVNLLTDEESGDQSK